MSETTVSLHSSIDPHAGDDLAVERAWRLSVKQNEARARMVDPERARWQQSLRLPDDDFNNRPKEGSK